MKKLAALFLALLLALTSAFALAEDLPVTVTDMFDRTVTLAEPATRVVAMEAADAEILCALGAGDMLVGRGAYCDYPESILTLPVVNSGAETNVEEIIALAPQVVIMSAMAQTPEQVEALEAAGIQVVLTYAQNIDGVYEAIRLIGQVVGKAAEAEELVTGMQSAFAEIAAKAENTGKTVYFEVSPLQWGLWTAGANTFMDELAALCGLTNAFADVDGWAEISEEQVLARDPDYIVTITMYFGEGPTPVEEIMTRSGWENLKAVRSGAILNADSNMISRPGPRLADAARELYEFAGE